MLQNNNKGVIKDLSKANIKSSKRRNYFVGIVIVLSVCVLAVIANFAYNASFSMKNRTNFHGSFSDVTPQVMQNIENNKDFDEVGVFQSVGAFREEKVSLTVFYSDEKANQMQQAEVASGTMPQKENDLLVEENFLKKQYPGKKVGDTISLPIRHGVSKEMQTKEFTVCGTLRFNSYGMSQTQFSAVVSKAYIENDPLLSQEYPTILFKIKDFKSYNNESIKQKIQSLGKEVGLQEAQVSPNNYFIDSNLLSTSTVFSVILAGFIILFACALVIYNIFYISIINKIKEYGQLRTIGTTSKQMRKIITREGAILSLQYIPFGILLSLVITFFLPVPMQLLPNLFITLGCCVFIFVTVLFSIRQPSKVAAEVSPIEATVYNAYGSSAKDKKTANKLTPEAFAKMNLSRNKKKSILTFLSLSVTGVLLITAATLMTSMDPALRAKYAYPYGGEYTVSLNWDLISPTVSQNDLQENNPLTEELKQQILNIDGVDSIVTSKTVYTVMRASGEDMKSQIENIHADNYKHFEESKTAGTLPSLQSAQREIVVNNSSRELVNQGLSYKVGDKITFYVLDGKTERKTTFTVVATVEEEDTGYSFFMTDNAMAAVMKNSPNTSYEILSKQGYSQNVEGQLRNLIAANEKLTIQTFKADTDTMRDAFALISTALYIAVGFIGCFSLINLLNTNIANLISRKKELGVMEAVGMTRKQIVKMLLLESGYLSVGSFIVSLLIGSGAGFILCNVIGKIPGMNYVAYKFPVIVVLAYVVIIAVVQLLLTYVIKNTLAQQTVTERLRQD